MIASVAATKAKVATASLKGLMELRWRIAPRMIAGQRDESADLIAARGAGRNARGRRITPAVCAIMQSSPRHITLAKMPRSIRRAWPVMGRHIAPVFRSTARECGPRSRDEDPRWIKVDPTNEENY